MGIELDEPRLIKDIVYSELKRRIIQGELDPGKRLIEEKLSEYFQISRTPLREAIQMLESEGLVTKVRSGGVKVSNLSEEEIKEIYDVRITLERRLIEYICTHIEDVPLNQLEEIVEQEKKRIKKQQHNILNALEQSDKFHEFLFKIYGNKYFLHIYEEFKAKTQRYAYLALSMNNRYKDSSLEHLKIFKLIKEQKTNEAVTAIEQHILHAQEATIEQLRKIKGIII